jgi:hypothetical protein
MIAGAATELRSLVVRSIVLSGSAARRAAASAVPQGLRRRHSFCNRDYQRQDALAELLGEHLDAVEVLLELLGVRISGASTLAAIALRRRESST